MKITGTCHHANPLIRHFNAENPGYRTFDHGRGNTSTATRNRLGSDNDTTDAGNNSSGDFLTTDSADQDDCVSETSIEENDHLVKERPIGPDNKCYLHRSRHALVLFGVYAILATFTWSMICILNFRPVTMQTYALHMELYKPYAILEEVRALYSRNDDILQAITIFQALVAVLTIPVASAIGTAAAVIFTQRNSYNSRTTLRQTMVLADKGWTDVELLSRLAFKGWKRYGSGLLAIAIAVHLLGGLLAPLQQYFLSEVTIQTPTVPKYVQGICSIPDHFKILPGEDLQSDSNTVTVIARSLMVSSSSYDLQSRLWYGSPLSCNGTKNPSSCSIGGASLAYMSPLHDPFVAQISSGFNTGVNRHWIPRINSTATVQTGLEESGFPTDCEHNTKHFYVRYSNWTDLGVGYDVMICMRHDQTVTPWKNTRRRQDFSETLYMNLTAVTQEGACRPLYSLYRVTLNTTAGSFELPNSEHSTPGPLLADGPPDMPGSDLQSQKRSPGRNNVKRQFATNSTTQLRLEGVANKGPLLTIAMALFGEGSFIANRVSRPECYLASKFNSNTASKGIDGLAKVYPWQCLETVPMAGLLSVPLDPGESDSDDTLQPCVLDNAEHIRDVVQQVAQYVSLFQVDVTSLSNAINAAAFLANEAWLTSLHNGEMCTGSVQYDLGAPSRKPSISIVGMAVISILLALYLASLFAIAMYSYSSPRWTSQLDSLAMMRIGAAMADEIALEVNRGDSKLTALDKTPGFIGDVTKGPGDVREIGLSFHGRLSMRRPYYSSCGS